MDIIARSNHGQTREAEFQNETSTETNTIQNTEISDEIDSLLQKTSSKTTFIIPTFESKSESSSTSHSNSFIIDIILHEINSKKVPFFNWTYKSSIRLFFLMKFWISLFLSFGLVLLTVTSYASVDYQKNWIELNMFLSRFLPDPENVTELMLLSQNYVIDVNIKITTEKELFDNGTLTFKNETTENLIPKNLNRFTATLHLLTLKHITFATMFFIWIAANITTDFLAVKSTFKNNWWQGIPSIFLFLPNVSIIFYVIYDFFTHLQITMIKLYLVDYECSWKEVTIKNVENNALSVAILTKNCDYSFDESLAENFGKNPRDHVNLECTEMCLGDLVSIGGRNGVPGDLNCANVYGNRGCVNEEAMGFTLKIVQGLLLMSFLGVFVIFYVFNSYLLIGYGKKLQKLSRRKHHAAVAFEICVE